MKPSNEPSSRSPFFALLLNNVAHIRRLPWLLRQLRHSLSYTLNDAFHWDEYAKVWERSNRNVASSTLGTEWPHREEFIAALTRHADPKKDALEIGCGGGRITQVAVGLFRRVCAVDVSAEMLRLCSNTVRAANLSFRLTDGFGLRGFEDESVDVIYSHDTFVNFSALQVYPYLAEIRRVLRHGGVGIISVVDFANRFEDFKRMSLKYWSQRTFPPPMRTHFTSEEVLQLMLKDLSLQLEAANNKNYLVVEFTKS